MTVHGVEFGVFTTSSPFRENLTKKQKNKKRKHKRLEPCT